MMISNRSSKRRACDECVQAKTKCCGSQPVCSRCARRGTICQYPRPPSTSPVAPDTTMNDAGHRNSCHSTIVGELSEPPSAEQLAFGLPVLSQMPPTQATGPLFSENFTNTNAAINAGTGVFTPDTFTDDMSTSLGSDILTQSHRVASTERVSEILKDYAVSLMDPRYESPLLHAQLYRDAVPDVLTLQRSASAVAHVGSLASLCTRSVQKAYLRRAIKAAKTRLIADFPSFKCMLQWDALHAACIYSTVNLPDRKEETVPHWKPGYAPAGDKIGILAKMAQRTCESHRVAKGQDCLNHTCPMFHNPSMMSRQSATASWDAWIVDESVRRLLFFSHIVNYFVSRDPQSGEQSPFYEPVGDSLILNLPLPCPSEVWNATSLEEWESAMHAFHMRESRFGWPQDTLKNVIAHGSADMIRAKHLESANINTSEGLRNFIILAWQTQSHRPSI